MTRQKIKILATLSCFLGGLFFLKSVIYHPLTRQEKETPFVHVYDWYGVIPKEVIKTFEKETGIRVIYDVYDSNDVLEAKLFSGNCGYDVVFPSLVPYAARQIQAGAFQIIDKKKLRNWIHIDPLLVKQVRQIDPDLNFILPFYWGTIGFLVNLDKVSPLIAEKDINTWATLFDEERLKKLSPLGISFLSESTDVYPLILHYMKRDPRSLTHEDLDFVTHHLLKIRSHIKQFSSGRFVDSILLEEVSVAQCWSGDSSQAEEEGLKKGKNIRYIIPREGTTLWIDVVAIPRDAPHPENALKFIDFLMHPCQNAKIINTTRVATVFMDARPLIDPAILKNEGIFPPENLLSKCFIEYAGCDEAFQNYDRERTRAWSMVRLTQK